MRWHSDSDERSARRDDVGNRLGAGQKKGQWARPEFLDQRLNGRLILCYFSDLRQHLAVGNVNDERIPVGTLLRNEDLFHSFSGERVRAEAVDRLCRKSDDATLAQNFGGAG